MNMWLKHSIVYVPGVVRVRVAVPLANRATLSGVTAPAGTAMKCTLCGTPPIENVTTLPAATVSGLGLKK